MADLPALPRADLAAALERTMSAHRLVLAGIATHAEKERARRQALHHQAETDQLVTGHVGPARDRLRGLRPDR